MFTKKEWIIFFAGAEALHTLSHIMLYASNSLPINFYFITLTPTMNMWAIAINSTATVGLLWWQSTVRR